MSTAALQSSTAAEATEYAEYKALSSAAVATLVLGILSLLAFLYPWFAVIPATGLLCGFAALRQVRANQSELTGAPVARAGMFLSLVFGIAGPSYQGYVYATEVPDWAERISYSTLQPDESAPGQVVPPSAIALNGKQVFIKGYIYPGQQQHGIRQFVLCRDQGDCCFGGNPKITDRIEVTLADPLSVSYSQRMFRVAGKFRVEPTQTAEGLGAVLYHIDAEYVK
jgi:hypothetical protein